VAIVRPGAVAANLAPRRLPITPVNSASGNAAACTLQTVQPRQGQLLNVFYATLPHRARLDSHIFFVLVVDVFTIGRS